MKWEEIIASPDKLCSQFLAGKQSPHFTKWLRWIPQCRALNPHKPFFSFCTHHLRPDPRRGSWGSRQSRWSGQKSLQTQAWLWMRWVWWWDRLESKTENESGKGRLQNGWVVQGSVLTFWWRPHLRICLFLSRAEAWRRDREASH